jgi:hypothetical protein
VLGLDPHGPIWHTWQKTPNGAWLGHWAELYTDANKLTTLEVANNADGRIEVLGLDPHGHIWHTWQA